MSTPRLVTAAILLHEGCVFLARRFPHDHGGAWEFPGGKLEPGETPEECLRREMAEEFGVSVAVDEHFADSDYVYGHGAIRLCAYRVRHLAGEFVPTVHAESRWVPLAELGNYELLPADVPLAARLQAEA